MLVLGLPLVLVPLFGGWLNQKVFRVTLAVQPRGRVEPAIETGTAPGS